MNLDRARLHVIGLDARRRHRTYLRRASRHRIPPTVQTDFESFGSAGRRHLSRPKISDANNNPKMRPSENSENGDRQRDGRLRVVDMPIGISRCSGTHLAHHGEWFNHRASPIVACHDFNLEYRLETTSHCFARMQHRRCGVDHERDGKRERERVCSTGSSCTKQDGARTPADRGTSVASHEAIMSRQKTGAPGSLRREPWASTHAIPVPACADRFDG